MTLHTSKLVTLVLLYISSAASGQPHQWAYALTDDLHTVPVRFDRINSETGMTGIDELQLDRHFGPDTLLAVWFDRTRPGMLDRGSESQTDSLIVELTDGQRVRVMIEESDDLDSVKATRFDGGQRVTIPIDRIRRISRSPMPSTAPSSEGDGEDDMILLANNDRLTGFITGIGPDITIETDTGIMSLPIDQVELVVVQNPSVHTPGIYVHTGLGERLRVSWFSADENRQLAITLDDKMYTGTVITEGSIGAGLAAVEYKRDDLFLTNPTQTKPIKATPTGGRTWAPAPTFKASSWAGTERTTLFIPSPMAIRWSLPPNAQRFSSWISTMNGAWTDNQTALIAITDDDAEHTLWSRRMTAESPRFEVLVDLPPNSVAIEIRIEPGKRGPIQDGVWISSPRVLSSGSPQFE